MAVVTARLTPWSDQAEFLVKFDSSSITVEPGDTACALIFPLEVTPDGYDLGPSLLALHGTMAIADPNARNRVEVPMQSLHPNYRHMRVPLNAADIYLIEARRAGASELVCNVTLGGLANMTFKPHPRYQGKDQAFVTTTVHDNGPTPFTIGREQWLSLLARSGFGWTRLVELPVLAGPAGAEWIRCTALLERATSQYRGGDSQVAISTCREVLEGLVTVVATRWGVPRKQPMRAWLTQLQQAMEQAWPQDKDAAGVLTSLYLAVWSWTSGSHHYDSRVPLHREAAFAVGLTSELLVHAGHLLEAHPEPLKAATTNSTTTDGSTPAASS
jgi:hypothetical protein